MGKILVDVLSIKNFPYFNNIYVRISCNPWVVQTRCVADQALDFKQKYYIPVHNTFNTLKVEVINSLNDGWLRNHVKDVVIAQFDIRLPDIDKEPFDSNGEIKLPMSEGAFDYKKLGLKAHPEMESQVKKMQ